MHLKQLLTGQRSWTDVWHYILGNYRYYFYYGGKLSEKYGWVASLRKRVVRKHIKEQIAWRIEWMDEKCYEDGSCKICGCATTALQMADKPCDKPCYPPMMNREKWKRFKNGHPIGFLTGKRLTHYYTKRRIFNEMWKLTDGKLYRSVYTLNTESLFDYVQVN